MQGTYDFDACPKALVNLLEEKPRRFDFEILFSYFFHLKLINMMQNITGLEDIRRNIACVLVSNVLEAAPKYLF